MAPPVRVEAALVGTILGRFLMRMKLQAELGKDRAERSGVATVSNCTLTHQFGAAVWLGDLRGPRISNVE